MMAVQEDQSGDHARLAKGKRTKRQRLASPTAAAAASTSSISSDGGNSPEAREGAKTKEMIVKGKGDDNHETTVVSRSTSLTGDDVTRDLEAQRATEEEEEMANCLMLLKQGHNPKSSDLTRKPGFLNSKKPHPPHPPSHSPSSLGLGLDGAYQCKTCDKSFSSFQALGGHRASHKKTRNVTTNNSEIFNDVQEKKSMFVSDEKQESESRVVMNSSSLSVQVTSGSSSSSYVHDNIKKPDRTHECSICKAEFSSGQALGGHMRRHRNANAAAATTTLDNDDMTASDHRSGGEYSNKRQRNFPELDLNLPAPEDDRYDKSRFSIATKDQILVFAPAAAAASS